MATARRKSRESDLQSQAMDQFERAFPELRIVRLNSGLAKSLHGGYTIHLAPEGTPDLVVPSLNLWVEMKKPGKPLEPEQLAWQEWAREHGVPHLVCDSPDDLVPAVRRLMRLPGAHESLTADMLRRRIADELRFSAHTSEYGYQDQLEAWLATTREFFLREVVLSKTDRVDFMVDGRIAVELKVKCPTNEILRQLARYAQHDGVGEILLLSVTRAAAVEVAAIDQRKARSRSAHWDGSVKTFGSLKIVEGSSNVGTRVRAPHRNAIEAGIPKGEPSIPRGNSSHEHDRHLPRARLVHGALST